MTTASPKSNEIERLRKQITEAGKKLMREVQGVAGEIDRALASRRTATATARSTRAKTLEALGARFWELAREDNAGPAASDPEIARLLAILRASSK